MGYNERRNMPSWEYNIVAVLKPVSQAPATGLWKIPIGFCMMEPTATRRRAKEHEAGAAPAILHTACCTSLLPATPVWAMRYDRMDYFSLYPTPISSSIARASQFLSGCRMLQEAKASHRKTEGKIQLQNRGERLGAVVSRPPED